MESRSLSRETLMVAMSTFKRIATCAAIALPIALILTAIATYLLHSPSNRVIMQWDQPPSNSYNSHDPFRLVVIERNVDWSAFPYREPMYIIYIGNDYPYGYYYRFPFYYHELSIEEEIKGLTIEWTTDGVRITSSSGAFLFIPREVFAGRQ